MIKALFLLFFAPFILSAQNVWNVNVGGGGSSGIDPYYSPQFLSIELGDTVRWANLQGTHNIDGRIETYPGNPDSFYSGEPSQNWVYEFVFNTLGSYGYQCNQDDHAQTQWGVISVSPVNSIQESIGGALRIYPNPFSSLITIDTIYSYEWIYITDLQGKIVFKKDMAQSLGENKLNLELLPKGFYMLNLSSHDFSYSKKLFKSF